MRKFILYFLYAVSALFACVTVYASVRSGSAVPLFLLIFLSPILVNAFRSPKAPVIGQAVSPHCQGERTVTVERVASDLSKLFKALAVFSLGLGVLFIILAPFWVLAGFAMGFAFMGALICYGLAKAFE